MKNAGKIRRLHWGWMLFTTLLFVIMIWSCIPFRRDFYVHATGNWYRKRILIYLLPMLLSVPCSQIRLHIPGKWHAFVRAFFVIFAMVVASIAFQSLCWDSLWYGYGIAMRMDCALLNISLTAVLFAMVWILVWDSRRAALTTYWLMCILGYAYRCVYEFRGTIFKATDVFTMQTGMAVAGNYVFRVQSEQAFWIAVGILLWMISLWIPRQKVRTSRMKHAKTAAVITAGVWIWIVLQSPLLDAMNISTLVWPTEAAWYNGRQGVLTTLMKEIKNLSEIRPHNYRGDWNALMDERLMDSGLTAAENELPNVIVVMNESLTDQAALWQVNSNQDALPFIHSLRDKAVCGNLYVSSFGGETCNTEHSFLTGTIPAPNLSMALLSTVKEDTPSLAWHLKGLGYRTIAIHPENPDNYQRKEFYPRLGLDTFISKDAFENAETLRTFVTDRACYEKIISLYETKAESEKLFVFNVTIQNHSPFSKGMQEEKIILEQGVSAPELQEFFNCVYESDQAFEELIAYFKNEEEPTIILMFGDHQPGLKMEQFEKRPELTDTAKRFTQYITPFVIWANYPIQMQYVEALSVNYLSALLLKTAGIPMTQYDEWLLEAAKQYPVVNLYGYGDSRNKSAFWDANEEHWPVELRQMNLLRYNRLYDPQNRLPALGMIQP